MQVQVVSKHFIDRMTPVSLPATTGSVQERLARNKNSSQS